MNQLSNERQNMVTGKSRKVAEHRMFTADGRRVYRVGHNGVTLDAAPHRLPCSTIDPTDSKWNKLRLERATNALGVVCEWRFHGETEVMDVCF